MASSYSQARIYYIFLLPLLAISISTLYPYLLASIQNSISPCNPLKNPIKHPHRSDYSLGLQWRITVPHNIHSMWQPHISWVTSHSLNGAASHLVSYITFSQCGIISTQIKSIKNHSLTPKIINKFFEQILESRMGEIFHLKGKINNEF